MSKTRVATAVAGGRRGGMKRVLGVLGLGLVIGWGGASGAQTVNARVDDPLAGLRQEHPRLLATKEDWVRIRDRVQKDALFAQVHATLVRDARGLLSVPPLERKVVGRRLLGVSRNLLRRTMTLAYAWQTTGERAFARRAEVEMLSAAEFADWNPSHFLDTAELATALALGYDWTYDALSADARAAIRRALVEKALRPGLDPASPHNAWHRAENNWSQVCFGGLALAALVVAEDEPELARELLKKAKDGIRYGLMPYAPDGVYPEGPSYWAYGTTYQAVMIAALESALGTDWGLSASEGFLPSAGAFLQTVGPTGAFYNHGDGGERPRHEAVVYWFARKTNDPGLALFNVRQLADGELTQESERRSWLFPLTALWWPEAALVETAPKLPLRWLGRGVNPIVALRESWTDRNSLYLAFKGGAAELNHAHMDAGSFVLERDGVRWAIDLGLQEYHSLEAKGVDLWNRAQNSQRWQVYRLNNHSHSSLTIDGQLHRVDGHATIHAFDAAAEKSQATVDLSAVFRGQAERVHRTFRWLPGRRVSVEDQLSGLAPGAKVRWQIPTRAEIVLNGREALLKQEGRTLKVRLSGPDDAAFQVEPAAPPADDFNVANPGVNLLAVIFTATGEGSLRFNVTFGDE